MNEQFEYIKDIPELPLREPESHKGNYGRVLVVAGSPGMTGAAYLAGKAALRSGSGLVTVACPESLNEILEIKLTCVMTMPVSETEEHTLSTESLEPLLHKAQQSDVVALGPGISQNDNTKRLVKELVTKISKPLVIDADGLNNIVNDCDLLKSRKAATILTPHPGEMARLLNITVKELQSNRQKYSVEFSRKYGVISALKGHRTIVAYGKKIYINDTGNPGMATAGSGDVLTGVIASLLGRGLDGFEAAQLAVLLHGLAGDIAAKEIGQESVIATDILNALPYAFMQLPGREPKEWPGFIAGTGNQ